MLTVLPLGAAAGPTALAVVPASLHSASHAPVHTLYERQDHRMLPVGTRIYYGTAGSSGIAVYVRPGEAEPPVAALRRPDVIVVSATDPRGSAVIDRLPHPQLCCASNAKRI